MEGTHRRVEFHTADGLTLRGNYYKPLQSNAPVIILTAGLSFLKEHFIDDFAARFQAAGYAALAYDHRNWGSSDGMPRHETSFFQQADDYSDAISYVSSLAPEIDPSRSCVWGAGHAGGVVIPVAAFDARVKSVIAMVPFISGETDASNFPAGYLVAALKEREARALAKDQGAAPAYVPTFETTAVDTTQVTTGFKDAIIPGRAASEFHDACFSRSKEAGTAWSNSISLQTPWHISKWEPTVWLHRITPKPFLYVAAEGDKFIPVDRQRSTGRSSFSTSGCEVVLAEAESGLRVSLIRDQAVIHQHGMLLSFCLVLYWTCFKRR